MFKKIKKLYYNWYLETHLYPELFMDIYDSFEIYGKVEYSAKSSLALGKEDDCPITFTCNSAPLVFKSSNEEIRDIFLGNVHIQIKNTETDKIITLSIKRNCDEWAFNLIKSKDIDTSNPINTVLNIYMWYDIQVLGGKRCSNIIFTKGDWSEYIINMIDKIKKFSRDTFFSNEFSEDYK